MTKQDNINSLIEDYIKVKLDFKLFYLRIRIKKSFLNKIFNTFFKIKNNRILFSNFHGMGFGCNPKYIAKAVIDKKLPVELFWVKDSEKTTNFKSIPKEVKLIEKYSPYFWYILLTSKIWVVNTTLIDFCNIDKREGQILIQTGHGSLGIKKVGIDDTTSNERKIEIINKEAKELDYFLSNSKFETEVYSRAFKFPLSKIKEFGHSRNDILFTDNKNMKEKVRKFYNIDLNSKILLYVPTFRKDGRFDCFNLDYHKLLNKLSEKFGSDWKILVRFHPRTIPFVDKFFKPDENIINATKYEDIQELLSASDIAITDYSSCIFDFMLLKNPAFIYATDYEDFDKEQGVYYPFSATPFPIAQNNQELLDNIEKFDYEKYKAAVENFLSDKGCVEDGKASIRAAELIENCLKD